MASSTLLTCSSDNVTFPVFSSLTSPAVFCTSSVITWLTVAPSFVVPSETVVLLLGAANATVVMLSVNVAAKNNPANFFIGLPPIKISDCLFKNSVRGTTNFQRKIIL